MAVDSEIQAGEALAAVVGFNAALRLCAFFGRSGARLHIPRSPDKRHPIAGIAGLPAMERLCQRWGGYQVAVPALDMSAMRRAGKVLRATQAGMSAAVIAEVMGIAPGTVAAIIQRLRDDRILVDINSPAAAPDYLEGCE